jgi:hypothetical protein
LHVSRVYLYYKDLGSKIGKEAVNTCAIKLFNIFLFGCNDKIVEQSRVVDSLTLVQSDSGLIGLRSSDRVVVQSNRGNSDHSPGPQTAV